MEATVPLALVTPVFVPLDLDLPLSRIVGIGQVQAQRLEKLGLTTVQDLLFHLPRRYEDTRETVPLRALQPGNRADGARAHPQHQRAENAVQEDGARRGDPRGRRRSGNRRLVQPAAFSSSNSIPATN